MNTNDQPAHHGPFVFDSATQRIHPSKRRNAMHLTLIKGGKFTVRSPSPAAVAPSLPPSTDPMLTVPRSCIVELIREFHELKAIWEDTKKSINRTF